MEKIDIDGNWPVGGLEYVDRCPICGHETRRLVYSGLHDATYFCAPGRWELYSCDNCGSGYLNPRPSRETIAIAYRRYFTHSIDSRAPLKNLGWRRRVRRTLSNGYRNYRFGTSEFPASRLGIVAAFLLPAARAVIDAMGRHLPSPQPGARILDIGCGNGDFLELAQRGGWQVVGVEPDPKAAEMARGRGLDVRNGGVEVLDPVREKFDGITLNHVIEHVHDPLRLLQACFQMLNPGGWIWLETPNFDALGHRRYGQHWRGIEAPRHLAIFTHRAIIRALSETGFSRIQDQSYRPLCVNMFAVSEAIGEGLGVSETERLSRDGRRAARIAERIARRDPASREFITVRAWKE